MCLRSLKNIENIESEGIGYKVLYRNETPYYWTLLSPTQWNNDTKQAYLSCSETREKYNTGFHIYRDLDSAKYQCNSLSSSSSEDINSKFRIVKVRYKNVVAFGEQECGIKVDEFVRDVIVARSILMLEEVKCE